MESQGTLRQFPLSQFHDFFSECLGRSSPSQALSGCCLFKRSQIDFISRFKYSVATGASRGKISPCAFVQVFDRALLPRRLRSQNQASVPIPGFSLRQLRNSIPRSKGDRSTCWLGQGFHHVHQPVHQMCCAAVVVAEQNSKACLALDQGSDVGLALRPFKDH